MTWTHLQQVQRLATSGARAVAPFVASGRLFLVVPQLAEDLPGQSADINGGNSDVDTIVYEWRNRRFIECQRLPSHGAEDAEFFRIGDRVFLAIAFLRAGRGPYVMSTRSVLYEWREDRFVALQEFASFAAKQWRHFTIGDRHFLALAQGVAIPLGQRFRSLAPKNPHSWRRRRRIETAGRGAALARARKRPRDG
jgi:hypothetical protein